MLDDDRDDVSLPPAPTRPLEPSSSAEALPPALVTQVKEYWTTRLAAR